MHWWQTAVFYQIYPRSFADGNGDGIGDLKGMVEKLDYLASLGIEGLWLSPHYPSPQFDCGYDIADYTQVNPEYGTLDEFKRFLDGAHARGMKVILDLVLNHTSDQHPWFNESRSSRDNPKRDWYIWRDGKNGEPPNNWFSTFDGQAWTLDETTGQYYYHYFFKEQPDLNWRNPAVKQAMWQAVRFWLELGVDGFRLDAIGTIYENPDLPNHPYPGTLVDLYKEAASAGFESEEFARQYRTIFQYQVDLPEVHDLMQELRRLVDEYPERMLVGETDDVRFYGDAANELHMVFNFPLMNTPNMTAAHVYKNQAAGKKLLPAWAWPANTLNNHDTTRVKTHFGDGEHAHQQARLWLALMLTLRGTPFLYNGEEIGMTDYILSSMSQVRDNISTFYYVNARKELEMTPEAARQLALASGRDKCRTPLQWANLPNAGFSPEEVETWLPVNPNYAEGLNVADQAGDPGSLLNFYRQLIRLRQQTPALVEGEIQMVNQPAEDCVAFLRTAPGQTCLVALNLANQSVRVAVDLPHKPAQIIYSSQSRAAELVNLADFELEPFGIFIGQL